MIAICACVLAPLTVAAIALALGHGDLVGYGDSAVLELTTREILSHPPLVGPVSRQRLHSPGPAVFVAFAPVYGLTGGATIGMYLGAALVSAVTAVGVVAMAYRRAGRGLALLCAAVLLITMHTIGISRLTDPWNPYVTLLPLFAVVLAAWLVADGDDAMLAVLAGSTSFVVQTHLSTLAVAGGLVFVAVVLRWRLPGEGVVSRSWWRPRRPPRTRSILAAVAVASVIWFPTLLDCVRHPPGNLAKVAKFLVASGDRQYGPGDGIAVARHVVGLPPSFVTGGPTTGSDNLAILAGAPWLPVGLVALVVCAAFALRRHRRDLTAPLALGLALVPLVAVSMWRLIGPMYGYVTLWTVIASAAVWVSAAWVGWQLVSWSRSILVNRIAGWVLMGIVIVASVVISLGAIAPPNEASQTVRMHNAMAQLTPRLDRGRTVAVAFNGDHPQPITEFDQGLVLALVKDGFTVVTPGQRKWFGRRDVDAPPGSQVVWVSARRQDGSFPPPAASAQRIVMSGDAALDLDRGT